MHRFRSRSWFHDGGERPIAGKIERVGGVRSDNGSVRCGLYSSPDGFRVPGREMPGAGARIRNGHATCVFSGLPAGTYAVAVFHAEHNEAQMETGLFGRWAILARESLPA